MTITCGELKLQQGWNCRAQLCRLKRPLTLQDQQFHSWDDILSTDLGKIGILSQYLEKCFVYPW